MKTGKTTIIPHDEPISASVSSVNASRVEPVSRVETATSVINTTSASFTQYTSLTDLCREVPSVQYLLEEWHTEYNSDPERNPNLDHISSPVHILPTDTSLVWWKCCKGHAW